MDDFLTALVVAALIVMATLGGAHLAMDYRYFNTIVAQCEKQGYIQNETVRINCTKEK